MLFTLHWLLYAVRTVSSLKRNEVKERARVATRTYLWANLEILDLHDMVTP
jgi:hypothetical protein